MKTGKRVSLIAAVCLMTLLAGCGANEGAAAQERAQVEGLDKLGDIQVIAREEGSGTRTAFAEIAGFQKNEEGKPDRTTDRAKLAEGSGAMAAAVEAEPSAIGYLSLGALDSGTNVKKLKVNGVEAGLDEKAYPLSRTFYLAYSGKLSPVEQDFLVYIHSAGQEYVADAYIPVAKSSSFLSDQLSGKILVGGSTSAAPLMEELAERYMEINPHAEIVVEATDSTDGLTGAMSGAYDLGMSSRDLKDYEQELLDYEAIARDPVAVIVNKENPLETVTMEELRGIYTGEICRWDELNP